MLFAIGRLLEPFKTNQDMNFRSDMPQKEIDKKLCTTTRSGLIDVDKQNPAQISMDFYPSKNPADQKRVTFDIGNLRVYRQVKSICQINKLLNEQGIQTPDLPKEVPGFKLKPHCTENQDMSSKARFVEITFLPGMWAGYYVASIFNLALYPTIALTASYALINWLMSNLESYYLADTQYKFSLEGFRHKFLYDRD